MPASKARDRMKESTLNPGHLLRIGLVLLGLPAAASPVLAQTDPPVSVPVATDMPLETIAGARLVTADKELAGRIERVVVDEFDNRFAEITVDTQLGLGERRVVVPLADLTWHEDIAAFLTTAEQDELDDLPESDDAFRPLPR